MRVAHDVIGCWNLSFVSRRHAVVRHSSDKREVPTANYVVRYTPKQTNGLIDGLVACELSARTYGASQWWVLLQCCGVDVCHKRALERGDISD